MPFTILVVDDDPDHCFLVRRRLELSGFSVRTAPDTELALQSLSGVDLVLLDHGLPDATGLDVLPQLRELGLSVVMVTGMGSESLAVEAMRKGAVDYVVKDSSYLDALPQVVERALRHHDLMRRADELERIGLVVTSAAGRTEVFSAIVSGARSLLRSDGCALFVLAEGSLVLEAGAGDLQGEADHLLAQARRLLAQRALEPLPALADRLLVPVPASGGQPLGVLAFVAGGPRSFVPGELRLARSLAAYAGIALSNLRRLDLERALVAELQEMLDLRREVMTSVSHELRTPLTCVAGFADTLLAHWDTLSDEDRRMFVAKVAQHSQELGNLVDRLLDFSQLEAGSASAGIGPVDLQSEVRATLDELAPLFDGRPLVVDVPSSLVLADPVLLRRTLTNLLSNALKYSERGTPVTVRAATGGVTARVEVVDEGVGIDPDEAARVFDPFWRGAYAHSASLRGAGIGLALVKEYVRIMGGHVSLVSEPGHGSTFVVELPLPQPEREAVS